MQGNCYKSIEISRKYDIFCSPWRIKKGIHKIEGINSRMDGIQAAILNVKLPYLKEWTRKREEVANYYSDSLDDLSEIVVSKAYDDVKHVWHLYVIQNKSRDLLANFLKRIMLKQR